MMCEFMLVLMPNGKEKIKNVFLVSYLFANFASGKISS